MNPYHMVDSLQINKFYNITFNKILFLCQFQFLLQLIKIDIFSGYPNK